MRIEQRLVRLSRIIRTIRSRGKGGARSQAIADLRMIGEWLCSHGKKAGLHRRVPSDLERDLSNLATEIYRERTSDSGRRLVVRLMAMKRLLGSSFYPNFIVLHPQLCADVKQLMDAFCHEVAHHTRGIERDHDNVFMMEMRSIHIIYRKKIRRRLTRSLGIRGLRLL